MVKLNPPIEQYLKGSQRTHTSKKWLAEAIGANEDNLNKKLEQMSYLSAAGKATEKAVKDGLVDSCEGKLIWRIEKVSKIILSADNKNKNTSPFEEQRKQAEREAAMQKGPKWVELEVVGTYFGVGKLKVGKWLDELGMRSYPKVEKNESGDYDMLDMARQAQQDQIAGPSGKKPTEKAIDIGLAKILTVTNRKQQEVEIVQWNLDLCKALLVKAGHKIDTEHKMALKGKGKNSNVQVNGIDARAKEIYLKWARLYSDPKTKWQAKNLFSGQPKIVLEKVEELMKMPGYLTEGRYLKD